MKKSSELYLENDLLHKVREYPSNICCILNNFDAKLNVIYSGPFKAC